MRGRSIYRLGRRRMEFSFAPELPRTAGLMTPNDDSGACAPHITQRGGCLSMIKFRDRMARGESRMGWLDSRHTFSFADYWDPAHMGFPTLSVINKDRVIPGAGIPAQRHRDMETITYVLSGALAHKDSLGNGATIRPGEVQRMSAGTGILHSEFNASKSEG